MMMVPLRLLSFIISIISFHCDGARILALFPIHGISNYNVAEKLLKALAVKGHQITVVTSFPSRTPIQNLRQIDVSEPSGIATNNLDFNRIKDVIQDVRSNFANMNRLSRTYCKVMFNDVRVQNLLYENFDLVINAIFGSDCDAGFAWINKAPLISILNARHTPWSLSRLGNPFNPSYVRVIHSRYPANMNYFQRMMNTYWYLYFVITYTYWHNSEEVDNMAYTFFGEKQMPSAKDLVYNTSMVFVNTHFSFDEAIPLAPNCVEIAGLHIKDPQPLPENIKKFMDEAEHGVIYFTLGSMVRTSSIPKNVIKAFEVAFASLHLRVLWKYERPIRVTSNILVSDWFPQNDIFNHSKLRLFISHGGNSGCIEAVHYGIPLIGIPLFYDQFRNIQHFVEKGAAIMLDIDDLSAKKIVAAIKNITENNKITQRMKELSRVFRDRPMTPLDTAVYWTEYVIRHGGAPHLKPSSLSLSWYQYYLLDVLLFLMFVFYFVSWLVYKTIKFFCCFAYRSRVHANISRKKDQ